MINFSLYVLQFTGTTSQKSLFFFTYRSVMLSVLQPKANITTYLQYLPSHELMFFSMLSVGSSCSFFYINSVLLFTLRSKQVFCETSRYILLFNLLFADTATLVSNLLLYILAFLGLRISYYACGPLILLSVFMITISPLTLAVMSFERFVAVCYPLRHAAIFTMRSLSIIIALVWAFSFIHILIRVFMLLYVFTTTSLDLQMNDFCSMEALFFTPIFNYFEEAYSSILFLSVGAIIFASYIGVVLVARSASTDKASVRKALQTLLLHLIQLSLILTSTLSSTILTSIARRVGRLTLMRIYNVCFVCLTILPRCLSALIYGLRDQTIRPALRQNLCCRWRCSLFRNKSH
ncbi:odorant receptor 131-2-like [Acanthopagrus latus]|uniref:odorant receptor 131-2-like n=1 Tax=Acanthopagrus latus TaxID=8177 RepID=UPI00187CC63D|nr:odorant receptor 131-2-like [Acanthopagrus latus]